MEYQRAVHRGSARSRPLVVLSLALVLLAGGCKQNQEHPPPPPPPALAVTICHGSVTDLLPRLALEKGYFSEEGVAVTLLDLNDGHQAFKGLLQGNCNFAVNGAPPLIQIPPAEANFTILATVMADDDSAKIIGRRDRGIVTPQDLKGKRIAVKKGIIGHFFLDLFLMKHGLRPEEVSQVFMESNKFHTALAGGEIDGFAMTNKMVLEAAKSLGPQATVFAEPGLVRIFGILTTRTDLPLNRQTAPLVLKALIRAERYAKNEPVAAKALVAKAYNISAAEIDGIWGRTTMEVALANSIFAHLEEQYKWQVESGLAPAFPTFPNYLGLVSPSYLQAIKPDSVSVPSH